jgi:ATP-binding cassette subfamily F protein 3
MLTIADVSKSYGTRELFSDVSLFVARTDRFGLVGPNGAGKSTLFNLILGEEQADEGTIEWERGADFGYLPQESAPVGDESILHIATSGKKLEPENDDDYDIDWTLEPRAKKILAGLGFREDDHTKQAKSFSGGWVMRAHLARLLVSEPALLLLDEPTNHLDLEALLWFQDYLTRYPGGLVIISHDREFLNTLCNGILELKSGTLNKYTGNYDDYLEREGRPQGAAGRRSSRTSSARSPTCRNSWTASAPRPRWPRAPSPRKSRSSASRRSPSRSRGRTSRRSISASRSRRAPA